MSQYEIVDSPFARRKRRHARSESARAARDIMAVRQYSAVEFRDEAGRVFHRYDLPSTTVMASAYRHYFRYFGTRYHDLRPNQLKFRFLQQIIQILRKIAPLRESATLLEIGATIGENYFLLKDALRHEPFRFDVEFVGIDLDRNAVALARELFRGDKSFHMVHGEASNLGRFPDLTFDIVSSNGVHNHLADPVLGIREAFRVARVAVVLQLLTRHPNNGPQTLTGAHGGSKYHLHTIKFLVDSLAGMGPFFLFRPSFKWRLTDRIDRTRDDGKYLEDVDQRLIKWDMVILSRYQIFPELPRQMITYVSQ